MTIDMHGSGAKTSPLYRTIYRLVRQIPAGRVASYGQIARIAGCSPRVVGYAMAAVPASASVPWQRVVNSRGEISLRRDGDGESRQRDLLEREGLTFDRKGRLDLSRVGWQGPLPEKSHP
ncbi:MAG: MGMT family protein [Sphingomonadales bacterium]